MIGALLMRTAIPKSFENQSRMDLPAMSRTWSEDVVLEVSGPSALSGRYEGKAEVERFFRDDWAHLASSHIEAKRVALVHPYAVGLSNVVMVEFVADVVSTDGVEGRVEGVSVVEVRRGKTVTIRSHYFDDAVIDAVYGLPAAHAS
jgi:ketosteroid isomerase-like protein